MVFKKSLVLASLASGVNWKGSKRTLIAVQNE